MLEERRKTERRVAEGRRHQTRQDDRRCGLVSRAAHDDDDPATIAEKLFRRDDVDPA